MRRKKVSRENLVGRRFDKLEVIEFSHKNKYGVRHWKCRCACGNERIVQGGILKKRKPQSCGCHSKGVASKIHTTHGLSKSRHYGNYSNIMSRCYNPKDKKYKDYGARGIKVCEEWRNDRISFVKWCELQEPIPKNFTLDRKNNEGDYGPDNCRFTSPAQQNRNCRRNIWVDIDGERLVIKDAVAKYGKVGYKTTCHRINVLSWDPVKAILTPPLK